MKLKLILIVIVVLLSGCDQSIDNTIIIKSTKLCISFGGINRITVQLWDRVICKDGTLIRLEKATIK